MTTVYAIFAHPDDEVLGARTVAFADFPDNRMDSVALHDVVQAAERFITEPPALAFTHHQGDLNIDHRIVHRAVVTACRPLPGTGPQRILSCEVNPSTEWAGPAEPPFQPTLFVDAGPTIERKLDALSCYAGELRPFPHPRSPECVRVLARWRGASCGLDYAEAFQMVRFTGDLENLLQPPGGTS